jgi:hypothetical protein
MAIQMLSKFEKYWLQFSTVLAIAVVLDPRYKLLGVSRFTEFRVSTEFRPQSTSTRQEDEQ